MSTIDGGTGEGGLYLHAFLNLSLVVHINHSIHLQLNDNTYITKGTRCFLVIRLLNLVLTDKYSFLLFDRKTKVS